MSCYIATSILFNYDAMMHLFIGKIGYLPKNSLSLDYVPKVDQPLVKYPLQGLNHLLIYPKGVFYKLDKHELKYYIPLVHFNRVVPC